MPRGGDGCDAAPCQASLRCRIYLTHADLPIPRRGTGPGAAAPGRSCVERLASVSAAQAQERKYLFEVGARRRLSILWRSAITDLEAAPAGAWAGRRLAAAEFLGSRRKEPSRSPRPRARKGVPVKSGIRLAAVQSAVGLEELGLRQSRRLANPVLGYGRQIAARAIICGNATHLCSSASGFGIGLTPLLMARLEGAVNPNKGTTDTETMSPETIKFTNYGVNLGVSLMLGSKPIPDSDDDGVPNNRDRCADTPQGAQVDGSGCPADNDSDGVANGVDRCPNTATGAMVDASGCTRTATTTTSPMASTSAPIRPPACWWIRPAAPRTAMVTRSPTGSTAARILRKAPRWMPWAARATRTAMACSTGWIAARARPSGATVNAYGCVAGPAARKGTGAAPPPAETPRPPASAAARKPSAPDVPAAPMVLEGVTFESGSARLQPGPMWSWTRLPRCCWPTRILRVEIGGSYRRGRRPADNMHLSTLRAEAVRNYLVAKGVPFQQVVARGYGATMPRTPDTTPTGRAANRRVEIRPLPPGP